MKAIAQRYAGALVDVAVRMGKTEEVRGELADFAALLKQSAELRNFLATPGVGRTHKQAVIEQLLARTGGGKMLRNFLFVLVDNRRAGLLPEIAEAFQEQLHARLGIAEAQVTSAKALSDAEKAALTAKLSKLTGKRVEARYALDETLIGGTVVRIGSTIYDGSVRQQLSRMREKLAGE